MSSVALSERRSHDGSPPGTSLKESVRIRSVGSLRKGWDVEAVHQETARAPPDSAAARFR